MENLILSREVFVTCVFGTWLAIPWNRKNASWDKTYVLHVVDGVGFNSTPLLWAPVKHRRSTCCGYYFFESTITHPFLFSFSLSLWISVNTMTTALVFLPRSNSETETRYPPQKQKQYFWPPLGWAVVISSRACTVATFICLKETNWKHSRMRINPARVAKQGAKRCIWKPTPPENRTPSPFSLSVVGAMVKSFCGILNFQRKKAVNPGWKKFVILGLTFLRSPHGQRTIALKVFVGTVPWKTFWLEHKGPKRIPLVRWLLWCGGDFSCCWWWWWFYVLYILLWCIMVLFSPCSYVALLWGSNFQKNGFLFLGVVLIMAFFFLFFSLHTLFFLNRYRRCRWE